MQVEISSLCACVLLQLHLGRFLHNLYNTYGEGFCNFTGSLKYRSLPQGFYLLVGQDNFVRFAALATPNAGRRRRAKLSFAAENGATRRCWQASLCRDPPAQV
jgi:hypothetical protein